MGKQASCLSMFHGSVGQGTEEDGRAEGQEIGNTACIQVLVKQLTSQTPGTSQFNRNLQMFLKRSRLFALLLITLKIVKNK